MPGCPSCGRTSPPERDTGYDGAEFCSDECEVEARPERHLLEHQAAGRWVPSALGARLLVFEEESRARFMQTVLNLKRFSRQHRLVPTRETDAELHERQRRSALSAFDDYRKERHV